MTDYRYQYDVLDNDGSTIGIGKGKVSAFTRHEAYLEVQHKLQRVGSFGNIDLWEVGFVPEWAR